MQVITPAYKVRVVTIISQIACCRFNICYIDTSNLEPQLHLFNDFIGTSTMKDLFLSQRGNVIEYLLMHLQALSKWDYHILE